MTVVDEVEWDLRQAEEHRRLATQEREQAASYWQAGAVSTAFRHLIDAELHDGRREAFEAAARRRRRPRDR